MQRKDNRAATTPAASPGLTLRQRAEASLRELPDDFEALSPTALRQMFHDLRVHQAELEMQNEELRQTQAALDTAQARYFDFYDLAPVGYLRVNARGLIEQANLTTASLLGVARGALIQQPLSHFILKADQEIYYRYRQRLIEIQQAQACELRLLKAGGAPFWAQLEAIAVPNEAGAPALRIVLRDISESKQMEQALAESEERFRLFMDTLPAVVFIKDEHGAYVFANCHTEQLIGEGDLRGRLDAELFPPEVAKKMQADHRRALEAGYVIAEEEVPLANGQLRFFQTHKFRIPRQGRSPLLGGIALDITEHKRAEEQLREMTAELENKVNERTLQLRQMTAQLMLTEERERRLLAQDLHDNLGQLLAVIKIKLSALDADFLQSSVNDIVKLVDQSDRAVRLITQQLSPSILKMLGFVPALEWLIENMERQYGLTVQICDKSCPKPLVDEIQAMLFRSVRELLINVAKHAQVSAATLAVSCDGKQMRTVVSDGGCGFKLVSVDGGWPGNGRFGLDSIHERMHAIGGQVEIDSRPGHGTTITLTLPCAIATKVPAP